MKRWKSVISFLYQKRKMLYLYYICFGERHIKAISLWKMKAADRRKIWNSHITVLYLDISLLQKALSQCYTLPDIGISRYGIRLIFLLMVFCCRRISQTCHFLPQEKFPVKPSAFESEIHPSHKSKICTLCISPCQGLTAIRRICS